MNTVAILSPDNPTTPAFEKALKDAGWKETRRETLYWVEYEMQESPTPWWQFAKKCKSKYEKLPDGSIGPLPIYYKTPAGYIVQDKPVAVRWTMDIFEADMRAKMLRITSTSQPAWWVRADDVVQA